MIKLYLKMQPLLPEITSNQQTHPYFVGKAIFIAILVLIFATTFKPSSLFFSSPTCQIPCAFNVVPGVTPYTEANTVLASFFSTGRFANDGYFSFDNGTTRLYAYVYRTDPREGSYVRSVEISSRMQGQVLSLGDLIYKGYIPHRVFRNDVTIDANGINLLITFGESEQIVAALSPQNRLNALSPINRLMLSNPQDAQWAIADLLIRGHYNDEVPWIGYADVSEYLRLKAQ